MTKTPEELTADWKEGKLEYGRYWVKIKFGKSLLLTDGCRIILGKSLAKGY